MRGRSVVILAAWLALAGCDKGKPSVTLYSDLDKSVVEPVMAKFRQEQNLEVTIVYAEPAQVERGVGLGERIREESASPQADLYWGVAPCVMEKLVADNLLDSLGSPNAAEMDSAFRHPDLYWAGQGGRVRVIVYHPKRLGANRPPQSFAHLIAPGWKGRCAYADPQKNPNANEHLLTFYATYGEQAGKRLLKGMKANAVQIVPTEQAVIEAVASGKADWGVTDSDLAAASIQAKRPLDFLVPDQDIHTTADALGAPRGTMTSLGTPALPYPIAIIRNRPHRRDSYLLRDFLFAPKNAAVIGQAMPNAFPTRTTAQDDPPGKKDGKITNPLSLRFPLVKQDKLQSLRSAFALARMEAGL